MNELSQAEIERLQKMSLSEQRLKKEGFTRIAGVDEAGRGPLAGPVVAVACILPEETYFENLNDSKQLTPASCSEGDQRFPLETNPPELHLDALRPPV